MTVSRNVKRVVAATQDIFGEPIQTLSFIDYRPRFAILQL